MDLDPVCRKDRDVDPLGRDGTTGKFLLVPSEVARVDLVLAWKVLRAGWRRAVLVAVGTVAVFASFAWTRPDLYTAKASFMPPSGSSTMGALAGELSLLSGSLGLSQQKTSGEMYLTLLGSRTLSDKIIDRFRLMDAYKVRKRSVAEAILADQSKFELGARDGVITLKVTDRSPERARDLANAYLDELHGMTGELAITEASQRRLFFEQQLQKEKDRLADAEVALRQVQESTGLIAPAGQTQVELQTIAQTRAAISSREAALAGLRASDTDQNRAVIRLRNEIGDLERQLATLEQGGGRDASPALAVARVPQAEMDYVRRERDVKYHEALFETLAKQYESARLDESHDAPVLQVVDYAVAPDTKSGPRRLLIVGASLILGVLLGAIYTLFKDRIWMLPTAPSGVQG